jgi:predicted ArsR family transcriptional regulator
VTTGYQGKRGGPATDEETKIKEVLQKQPLGMNIKEIAGAVGMSRNSVAKYLDVLAAVTLTSARSAMPNSIIFPTAFRSRTSSKSPTR